MYSALARFVAFFLAGKAFRPFVRLDGLPVAEAVIGRGVGVCFVVDVLLPLLAGLVRFVPLAMELLKVMGQDAGLVVPALSIPRRKAGITGCNPRFGFEIIP